MSSAEQAVPVTAPAPRPARPGSIWAWLGVLPFFIWTAMFMGLPALFLLVGSFTLADGGLGIDNYRDLTTGAILPAFVNSIQLSFITAVVGAVFGLLLASAAILGKLPRVFRSALMTFSGVASNFAGVPLALAFVFTLGNLGLVTKLLQDVFGFSLRGTGFSLYSMTGLAIVYLYFQFPLMVLVIAPSIEGLRREWREAAENLGATSFGYWRRVALPILTPSILGAGILLFGNAFGAQATAYQLSGGTIPLATLVITAQMQGDVLFNPGLGYAAAMGMVFVMGLSILAYSVLQRRAERWLRS
ncbi:MAG TPA: ABC transporter permease subunit [Candidatus Limnocylindrales bacterium]|nr:ABC transporter permease subunit [Candidatus Limnocylindrales bacterium]